MEWLIAIGLIWLIVRTWGDKGRTCPARTAGAPA